MYRITMYYLYTYTSVFVCSSYIVYYAQYINNVRQHLNRHSQLYTTRTITFEILKDFSYYYYINTYVVIALYRVVFEVESWISGILILFEKIGDAHVPRVSAYISLAEMRVYHTNTLPHVHTHTWWCKLFYGKNQ